MADWIRARAPRGGQQRPRVACVLTRVTEPGQSAPLTPPAPPALSRALISNFLAFSFLAHSSSHLRVAIAISRASSPSPLLHHHGYITSTLVTRRVHVCPLTMLGKLQHCAQACRSPAAESAVVAMPFPSTTGHEILCAGFTVVH